MILEYISRKKYNKEERNIKWKTNYKTWKSATLKTQHGKNTTWTEWNMQTAQHENPQNEKSATGKECNMKKYNCTKLNNYEL